MSCVFRDVGYEGASLNALSEATGLQRSSLYHRFPGGKEEMARAVLAASERWLDENALAPLRAPGPPSERVRSMIDSLDEFYAGGRQSCLVNMLSSPQSERGPFAEMIKTLLRAWISSLTAVLVDAGFDSDTAALRAERAIALVQGSLVVSRGLQTTRPFRTCLASLEHTLLSPGGSAETI